MLIKRGTYLVAILLIVAGIAVYFARQQEVSPAVTKTVPTPIPAEAAPSDEINIKPSTQPIPAKREAKTDTTPLEPCFSYWAQQHRIKLFEKKNFPNKDITLEKQQVENLPKVICNLKVRNEFYSVMLATQPTAEKLVEITEAWLKPSGDELEVYRPDGSAFKKNQVLGFWGALELDSPTTSTRIKNCGADLGWGLQCPEPK